MNRNPFGDVSSLFDEMFNTLESVIEFPWERFASSSPLYTCPSFPPVDVIVKNNKDIIFKFALAGYEEDSIELEFEGDYMILTLAPQEEQLREDEHYLRRGIKKTNTRSKYYVPSGLYQQDKAEAKFRKGLLVINIPSDEKAESKKVDIQVDDE